MLFPRELHPLKVYERKLKKNPVFTSFKDDELAAYLTKLPLNVRQAHEIFQVIATYHNVALLQEAKLKSITEAVGRTHTVEEIIW